MYCNTKTLTADSKKSEGDPDYDALNDGLNTWKTWTKADPTGSFTEVNSPAVIESMGTLNFVKGEETDTDGDTNNEEETDEADK